jgi:hypothetical protein
LTLSEELDAGLHKGIKRIQKQSGRLLASVFESVHDKNEEPVFLVYDNGSFRLETKLDNPTRNCIIIPITQEPYPKYCFVDDDLNRSTKTTTAIFQEVRRIFEKYVVVDGIWLDVFAALTLLSYQQEKTRMVPYLFLIGDNESGKSIVTEIMSWLFYRMQYSTNVNPADIYSYIPDDEEGIPTIGEDELQGLEVNPEKTTIYKSGYTKGAKVPRVQLLDTGREVRYYRIFCLKVFTAERLPNAKKLRGFNERCIVVPMTYGHPKKTWRKRPSEADQELLSLRKDLLQWRMANRNSVLPDVNIGVEGRIEELWIALVQTIHELPDVEKRLLSHIKSQSEKKLKIRKDSIEGYLIKSVCGLIPKTPSVTGILNLQFIDIWSRLQTEINGTISEAARITETNLQL